MKKLLFGLLLFFSTSAFSQDQIHLAFGPSIDGSIGNPKFASIAYEKTWSFPMSLLVEGGTWTNGNWNGFVGCNLGVKVQTTFGLVARFGVGPTYVAQTDDRLATHGEFNIQGALGFEQSGWGVDVKGVHFSDANIGAAPGANLGRDFVVGEIVFPLP